MLSHAAPSLRVSSLAWTNPSWRQHDPIQLLASLLNIATSGVNWCQSFQDAYLSCGHLSAIDVTGTHQLFPRRGHHATAGWSWGGKQCAWSEHLPHPPATSPRCCQVPWSPQLTPRMREQPAHGTASLTVAETRKTSRLWLSFSVSHCRVVRCCKRSSRMV